MNWSPVMSDVHCRISLPCPSNDAMRCCVQDEVGSVLKTLTDYTAVKEDEISVAKGDTVQVLQTNLNR